MEHDEKLTDLLSGFKPEPFANEVFRARAPGLDPTVGSSAGGRWGRRDGATILYTSVVREGALAELTFHWGQNNPRPPKPIVVHRLALSARKVIRITCS